MKTFLWASKFLRPKKLEKIRIGNNADGGYVLPKKCLEDSDLCASFGLGNNITFENDLIKRNIKVIGFDINTSKHPEWARQLRLETYDDFSALPEVAVAKKIILKVDTEGSEWEFFNTMDMQHFAETVYCFAFELHLHMNPSNLPLSVMEKMFESHDVVHVHGNNFSGCTEMVPLALEITLANKKYFENLPFDFQKYPIQNLDFKNKKHTPELALPWLNQMKLL